MAYMGTNLMSCFRCGVCCIKYPVRISIIEARIIADNLGLNLNEFLSRYVDTNGASPDSFLLRRVGDACIFLQKDGNNIFNCSIHSFKPSACKEWNPSQFRKECKKGLAKLWGLMVNASGAIEGPGEKLKRFCSFFKTLQKIENYPEEPYSKLV